LKAAHGGSIPPFLVMPVPEFEHRLALQMCGKVEGSHEVILHSLMLALRKVLLA